MKDYLSTQTAAVLAVDPSADVIDYQGEWTTWGQLGTMVSGLCTLYDSLGLAEGTGVGCVLRNRAPGVAMILAAAVGGTAVLTINPAVHDDKLVGDVDAVRPAVVVAEPDEWARPGFAAEVEKIGAVGIRIDRSGASIFGRVTTVRADAAGEAAPGVLVHMLTSGTTGAPKRIPLRRKDLADTVKAALAHEGGAAEGPPKIHTSGARVLSTSIVHMGGLWEVLATMLTGRPVSMMDKFNVDEWRKAVVRHRPKVCLVAPAGLRMILDADVPAPDISSLLALRTGSAPCEVAVINAFEERYDLPILQTYGATEFAGVIAGWSLKDWTRYSATHRDSVGRLYPTVAARIVDSASGSELPLGKEGLLEVDLKRDGNWMRTTDLAVLDEEQFLWINGRADNAIIRGGFKVLPDEVANVLIEHPGVRDACVVGMPDRRLGAVPMAAIATKAGQVAPTAKELKEWVRTRMPPYKVPVAYLILDELPRTPSLKPSVAAIKEMFERAGHGQAAP